MEGITKSRNLKRNNELCLNEIMDIDNQRWQVLELIEYFYSDCVNDIRAYYFDEKEGYLNIEWIKE